MLSRLPQPATEKYLSPELRFGGGADSENRCCDFVVGESGHEEKLGTKMYVI